MEPNEPLIQSVKGVFSRIKLPGREAGKSPLFSADVKNMQPYTSTTSYAFTSRSLIQHSNILCEMFLVYE